MRTRALSLALAPVLTTAVLAAGCGSDNSNKSSGSSGSTSTKDQGAYGSKGPATTSTATTGSGGAAAASGQLKLSTDPSGALKFDTSSLSAKAGKVTLDFQNSSSVAHAVEVEGHGVEKKTKMVTGGGATITVNLKKGKYDFYCPVDGHRAAGMKGTLTVS